MPGIRPRVSLLSALLLTAIVGMAIVIVQLWREVEPLRAEVRRLRDEVGVLSVDDPAKVCAIQVDTRDELTWKWRVWVPENRRLVVRGSGGDVPKDGFPSDGGSIWIDGPGEQVIVYRIDRERPAGDWYGSLKVGGSRVGKDPQPWVNWSRKTSTSGGVTTTTRSFEPNQRVELIRHRVSQSDRSDKIEDPAAGFMIWLEPAQ